MNKLEEQIEQQLDDGHMHGKQRHIQLAVQNKNESFKDGAQFVIDLELPVKFLMWWKRLSYFDQGFYENETKAYKHWIENIYGR